MTDEGTILERISVALILIGFAVGASVDMSRGVDPIAGHFVGALGGALAALIFVLLVHAVKFVVFG